MGFRGRWAVMVCFVSFCHITEFGEELSEPELHELVCLRLQYRANRLETVLPKE